MKRSILRLLGGLSLCAAVLLGNAGSAQAWYKVTNKTPNNVWMTHAFWSMSGLGCGYNDGCDNNSTSGWRVHGWWMISPGGTAIIQTENWGNAAHEIQANDFVGHFWGGTSREFNTPNTVFNRCQGLFTDLDIPLIRYVNLRNSACCGGSCTSNFTTSLILN
jgi:hypothetical protein